MKYHSEFTDIELYRLIRMKAIVLGGHKRLKIFGTLRCKSGRKMKKSNRVFFHSAGEAMLNGFRPCGACMKDDYKNWKNGSVQR